MTQETPGKIFSLLGVAMFSLTLMFVVTVSDASFDKVYNPLPQIASPTQVVSALDFASNAYSKFIYANLINPAEQQYAFVSDNVGFVADNAGPQLMAMAGLEGSSVHSAQPQVAGASTEIITSNLYPSSGGGFGLFSLILGSNK
jgi:hypothetical protein